MEEKKGFAVPADVYDSDGNMTKIEFTKGSGEHLIDAVWDENDEQTSENRIAFRQWAYKHLRNQGWEILK